MKQVVLALTVVFTTFALGLLAVSVAQKDSRERPSTITQIPDYSKQQPVPIPIDSQGAYRAGTNADNSAFNMPPPPGPIVRANDSFANDETSQGGLTYPAAPLSSFASDNQPSEINAETQSPSLAYPMPAQGSLSDGASNEEDSSAAALVQQAAFQDGGTPASPFAAPFPTTTPPSNSAPANPLPNNPLQPSAPALVPTGSNGGLIAPPVIGKTITSTDLQSPGPFGAQNPSTKPAAEQTPPAASSDSQGTAKFAPPVAGPPTIAPLGKPAFPVRAVPDQVDPTALGVNNRLNSQPTAFAQPATPATVGTRTSEAVEGLVRDVPGERLLDGAQNPSLQIHKKAPEEIQVGQPAVFSIVVRNVGNFTAQDVRVFDRVPRGTRLVRTTPQAAPSYDGSLVWTLGELPTGAEQTISIELIPEIEGEIGSVANVSFNALASVRTVSTQPRLDITQTADPSVLLGEKVLVHIQVTNTGTGTARNVTVEEDVPPGLRHPLGPALGLDPFDLAPGQVRTIDLELIAAEPGLVKNQVRATSSNAQAVDATSEIQVVAPQIALSATGPKLRYLERQANYQITVTNNGTATARNIDLVAYLPRGMQFNSAGNQGEYLPEQHLTAWNLEELAPGATATTELTVMPIEEGEFVLRLQCRADGIEAEPFEKPVRVEGQSELAFSIDDENDPIETDGQTTYVIKLSNVGTRNDQNVQVALELPSGATVIDVRAAVGNVQSGSRVIFDPIPDMKAKDQVIYKVTVKLPTEGTQIARVFVKSESRKTPVVQEESTQVYLDR
jgi:uncharacterized repeat protein (TIGR01451 family)